MRKVQISLGRPVACPCPCEWYPEKQSAALSSSPRLPIKRYIGLDVSELLTTCLSLYEDSHKWLLLLRAAQAVH